MKWLLSWFYFFCIWEVSKICLCNIRIYFLVLKCLHNVPLKQLKVQNYVGISCQSTSLSGKIKDKLFKNYDKSKTIIQNVSNTTVKIGISVIHLDIDEKNRIMTSDLWMRFVWQDKELTWEPRNFGNVSNIKVKPDSIWKPDITLYNR